MVKAMAALALLGALWSASAYVGGRSPSTAEFLASSLALRRAEPGLRQRQAHLPGLMRPRQTLSCPSPFGSDEDFNLAVRRCLKRSRSSGRAIQHVTPRSVNGRRADHE